MVTLQPIARNATVVAIINIIAYIVMRSNDVEARRKRL